MATLAPSAARRLAIAAPIPREPPVTSAALLVKLDTVRLLSCCEQVHRHSANPLTASPGAARRTINTYVRITLSSGCGIFAPIDLVLVHLLGADRLPTRSDYPRAQGRRTAHVP